MEKLFHATKDSATNNYKLFIWCNKYFQDSSVNKLGIAAPTSDILDLKLSETNQIDSQELQRRKQVEEFVSKLTPEQLKQQQIRVQVKQILLRLTPFLTLLNNDRSMWTNKQYNKI